MLGSEPEQAAMLLAPITAGCSHNSRLPMCRAIRLRAHQIATLLPKRPSSMCSSACGPRLASGRIPA